MYKCQWSESNPILDELVLSGLVCKEYGFFDLELAEICQFGVI